MSTVAVKRTTRVLMYTSYFTPEYSGAALQALTLARELRARGHHVEFVTNRWPGLPDHAVVDGFAVRRVERGRMRKHNEFRLWFNLVRYVWSRRRDFDILHSHGAYFTNAFIGPLARILGMKSLIKASLADDDLKTLSHGLVGRLHRMMLQRIDACVGISHDLVDEFVVGGLKRERVHHVPNGVDVGRFHPVQRTQAIALRRHFGLPLEQRIALYVGVLDQRKNILWLAEQWVANNAFGTDALLLAVGPQGRDDPSGRLHTRLAELAGAHPRLFALHDFCPDVTPYYQCVDLLMLPSVKEGLPNVVLEAMACGLPCVAARASGTRELVIDGETGFTYTGDDVGDLAAAVTHCLSEEGAAMGQRALELALKRYSISAIADSYEAIYARMLHTEKRVLYVENGIGYGGAIICLRHLVRNLDRVRFEPMVVTGLGDEKYRDIANDASWKHIPDKHVDVISMKRALASWRWPEWMPGSRWLLNQVLSRLDDFANFLPSFVQTLWTVIRFKPDLIHVNNEPLCNRAAVLAGKLLSVPVVSHVRGDQQGSPMMHSFFKLPDYFIAVSRWVSDSIGRIGVPERKRTYVYDGIELDKLDLRADGLGFRHRHGIAPDAFVVGLVGLLIPWKGQRLFIEAVRELAQTLPDAVFAMIGGTPEEFEWYEHELRTAAAEPKLAGRLRFTGHVADMAAVYHGLDVVVSASTSPEPLGTMIIEAMTMARPVLAPNHGGAVEMIRDGDTGLLFVPGNAADLGDKIKRLHADTSLRGALGRRARAHALETFSIQEHVRRVESVYLQVLESRANAR